MLSIILLCGMNLIPLAFYTRSKDAFKSFTGATGGMLPAPPRFTIGVIGLARRRFGSVIANFTRLLYASLQKYPELLCKLWRAQMDGFVLLPVWTEALSRRRLPINEPVPSVLLNELFAYLPVEEE